MSMSVHEWVVAWEAAMAEAGFANARLSVEHSPFVNLHDGPRFSYWWTPDVDQMVDVNVTFYAENSWDEAHRAFVAVDHLRPKVIEPSPLLSSLLTPAELDKDADHG